MNDDSDPYNIQQNSLAIPIQNFPLDGMASVNPMGNNQEPQDNDSTIATVNMENTNITQKEKPKNVFEKVVRMLKKFKKILRKQFEMVLMMSLSKYLFLIVFFWFLMNFKVITTDFFLFSWFLLSFWLIIYRVCLIFRNSNSVFQIFRSSSRQNEQNILIPSEDNQNNQNNGQNYESNQDVLRRREAENLVAFHPLRFHMIVGRLHNILNQLRENQMIINAAVMGNRGGNFNFREFQDLILHGLNRGNVAPQNQGFTQQEIDNLPEFTYEKKQKEETIEEGEKKNEEEEQCSICLMEFHNSEIIRTLPCIHNFHKECIDQWLKRQKYCPLCKGEVMFN